MSDAVSHPKRFGQTNFGVVGFAFAVAWNMPVLLLVLHVPMSKRIADNISLIIFDWGLIADLGIVFLCILGIVQGRRNLWFGIAGIAAQGLWWVAMIL